MDDLNETINGTSMDVPNEEVLEHYGIKERSGRYPYGSGENPYQHDGSLRSRVRELKDAGLSEKEIADSMNLTTTQLRVQMSMERSAERSNLVARAKDLRAKGYSLNEIAKQMGYSNDSSVRALLNEDAERRMGVAETTADYLRKQIEEKGMVDVGAGVERELGVSKEKLNEALYILELEGYPTYGRSIPQPTNPGQNTTMKILCAPGTEHSEIYDLSKVGTVTDYISYDNGNSFYKAFEYPESLNSKRLAVRYGDEGGKDKDGVIEIRRGVKDLDLGESRYAQVRIMVDGTHYLKGMAVYSDDLPDGVDVLFNTNKDSSVPVLGSDKNNTVLKKIKSDPSNPFGALIKEHGGQSYYDDPNGKFEDPVTGEKRSLSLINKAREEGDWGEWSNKLPSQFLSKQPKKLIKQQLSLAMEEKQNEYDAIMALDNPTIKSVLLEKFANDCDSASEHLQAAALPRQKYKVILPVTSLKDTEVYAPDYMDGEKIALIRYPHGGTFEIPVLTVNNKQKEAKDVLGNAKDGVGINSKVAARLSGADFDGDTVMVIPITDKSNVKSTPPLKGLEGFDPGVQYGGKPAGSFKPMKDTQKQMGVISNLITDMTLKGASEEELARAVRHSMVVIDAEKHGYDYQQSEKDNGIAALKKKYQGHYGEDGRYHEGASTIISRATSEQQVLKRVGTPKINQKGKSWYDPSQPEGALIYKSVVEEYTDKSGKKQVRTQPSTKMAETRDARSLISDYQAQAEIYYADYANYMKDLANKARISMVNTPRLGYSASAKKTYDAEVKELNRQLDIALLNAPKERRAATLANIRIAQVVKDNPDMTKKEKKKLAQISMTEARNQVGAHRVNIDITDKQWEAIQAGAISDTTLRKILNNTDLDKLRERATPKTSNAVSTAKINRIKSLSAAGYTTAQIADFLNLSSSTVSKYA